MEQRVVMKFLVNEGVKPADIYSTVMRRSAAVRHLNGENVSKMAVHWCRLACVVGTLSDIYTSINQ
jgi:hypothetical protein